MPKAVPTREAQNALSSLIGWVQEHHDQVIIENRGKPTAVLIAFEEYEQLQAFKEQQRRRAVWEQLRALQARVAARNTDLSEEEAEVLADEVSREAMEALIEQGRVRFER
jgi:prevent-host-death family protein